MKLFSRFLPVFCVALFSAMLSMPVISQAAVNDIAGTWSVAENYGASGTFSAVWKIVKQSETAKAIKYKVTATRPGGFVQNGTAKLKKSNNKASVKHPCYGTGCGSCAYKFKGTATPTTISGSADYCAGAATGTFVATRTADSADEGIVPNESDNGLNPN